MRTSTDNYLVSFLFLKKKIKWIKNGSGAERVPVPLQRRDCATADPINMYEFNIIAWCTNLTKIVRDNEKIKQNETNMWKIHVGRTELCIGREKSWRAKMKSEEQTNSFYLHYKDMKKMALVCCGSGPGPLLIEGNSLHTPPHLHILGVGWQ